MQFNSSVRIDAPADKVWATVVDLRKLIAHIPNVVSVDAPVGAPVQGGVVTVTVDAAGRRLTVPARLTTVAPPSKLVIDADLPDPVGAPAEAVLALTAVGAATDVRLGVTLKLGMLKEMAAKAMIGTRGQDALDEALAQLKRQVEGG